MSDSLVLINKALSGGENILPRYVDMVNVSPEKEDKPLTKEQVYSKFDRLRRKP